MLANIADDRSTQYAGSRVRSLSGSSAMLLNRASEGRVSVAFDMASTHGGSHSRGGSSGFYTPITPTTPGAASGPSNVAGYQPMASTQTTHRTNGAVVGLKHPEASDPYYRPPRLQRRAVETRFSLEDGAQKKASPADIEEEAEGGPSYHGVAREDSDLDENNRQTRKDYAVREVDFYYGVRGPALSHTGTRKLKTGPADPTGPVSSATGWFQRLLGGKTKEPTKGFEVVRSTRAPPPGLLSPPEATEFHEPYRDDSGTESGPGHSRDISAATAPYRDSDDDNTAPKLPEIDAGSAIELPSRIGSQRTVHDSSASGEPPPVPRKSSRRKPAPGEPEESCESSLIPIPGSPVSASPHRDLGSRPASSLLSPDDSQPGRLPFAGSESGSKERSVSGGSTRSSLRRVPTEEQGNYVPNARSDRLPPVGYVPQHQISSSIHHETPGKLPDMTGSSAELVEQNES
jgi:hypothetical protein